MTQRELEKMVAQATGEEVRQIRRRGFSIADPLQVCFDPEPDDRAPLTVDWDLLESRRRKQLLPLSA